MAVDNGHILRPDPESRWEGRLISVLSADVAVLGLLPSMVDCRNGPVLHLSLQPASPTALQAQ